MQDVVKSKAKGAAVAIGGLIVLMYAIQIINMMFGQRLNQTFGIQPRNVGSILDIISAPLFHANWQHLVANSGPFIVLGVVVFLVGTKQFAMATGIIWVTSGLTVWLIGASGVTIGASGIVFGFFGYLVARGLLNRRISDIIIAVVITAMFGYLLWGILPQLGSRVSWQGHLGGLVGGIIAAYVLRSSNRRQLSI